MGRKTTNYLRRLGWTLTIATIVFSLLLISGVGNRDACLDAGGRWISGACEGSDGFVPLARRPRVWLNIAPTLVLGLALIIVARKRSTALRTPN